MRDAILAMPAGPEMDALVAEKVMGLKVVAPTRRRPMTLSGCQVAWGTGGKVIDTGEPSTWGNRALDVPPFSTDIATAMIVLCKIRGKPPCWFAIESATHNRYLCNLGERGDGIGDTISEAICRAALAAATT